MNTRGASWFLKNKYKFIYFYFYLIIISCGQKARGRMIASAWRDFLHDDELPNHSRAYGSQERHGLARVRRRTKYKRAGYVHL